MSGVLFLFSILICVLAAFATLPALYALWLGNEGQAIDFAILSGLGIFVGLSVYIALYGRKWRIGRVHSYLLLTISWLLLPLLGALPFLIVSDMPLGDAYFEAVSGFTTTGASIVSDPSVLGQPILLWRSMLQWCGGLFTLLGIILILAPSGIGGLPDRHIKLIDQNEEGGGTRVLNTVREVTSAYALFTGICYLSLLLCGIDAFDALCLSLSTLSTGGFLPRAGDISSYQNAAAEVVLIVFMLIGGTSILWHRMLMQQRLQLLLKHRESYYVIGTAVLLGIVIAALLFRAAGSATVLSPLTALREGIFTAVSLVTTTGFEVRHDGFTVLPLTVILFVAFVGGGTFSTAGGLKHYRMGGMWVQATRELSRLIYPHGIRPAHFGSQPYDIQLMKSIWSYFAIAIFVIALGSLFLAMEDIDFEGALIATISSFANLGTIYTPGWMHAQPAEWPALTQMDNVSKLTLSFIMILGRLEILVLFAALNRTYWTQ
ncbi:MAG: potassium transporter TrkG [Stappiaceae bacterium]